MLLVAGICIILGVSVYIVLSGNRGQKATETDNQSQQQDTIQNDTTGSASQQPAENKLCDWLDDYSIVIHLNFAEGVVKDTSYEAGFAYSSIASNRKLARGACDYRTAFKPSEMKNRGVTQVVVWGYTDNKQRQLAGDPITVIFDENGNPDVALPIEVTVLN